MQSGPNHRRGVGVLASGFLLLGLAATTGLGDDPPAGGRLARLFRFGSTADSSAKPASASSNDPGAGRDLRDPAVPLARRPRRRPIPFEQSRPADYRRSPA